MAQVWKSLPSWVRNIVVPIVLVVLLWKLLWFVIGVVSALLGFAINVLLLVGLAAVVVILLKKASKS